MAAFVDYMTDWIRLLYLLILEWLFPSDGPAFYDIPSSYPYVAPPSYFVNVR